MVKKLEKIGEVERETSELLNYNLKCMKDLQKLKIKSGLKIETSPVMRVRPKKRFNAFSSQTVKRSDIKKITPS
jgi:hypothetical protein